MRPARLTGPGARFLLGVAGLVVSGMSIDHDHVGRPEEAVFRGVNELPDSLYRPAWLVMQVGTIGAVPVAAVVALATGRRLTARRVLQTGTATWLVAKAVKRAYGRPRPASLLATARCRGEAATGMGYVSGHAGISTTLALSWWPELGPVGRWVALVVPPVVGATRVYVGAHLPLDVLGGVALGLAVDGARGLVTR